MYLAPHGHVTLRLRGGDDTAAHAQRKRASERESVITAGIRNALAQEEGIGKGKKKKKPVAVPARQESAEEGGEVFERDGLEFRRSNDDAAHLLKQLEYGSLGDDPLEKAHEFMDPHELHDWDALYDEMESDADDAGGDAPAEYIMDGGELTPAKGKGSEKGKKELTNKVRKKKKLEEDISDGGGEVKEEDRLKSGKHRPTIRTSGKTATKDPCILTPLKHATSPPQDIDLKVTFL